MLRELNENDQLGKILEFLDAHIMAMIERAFFIPYNHARSNESAIQHISRNRICRISHSVECQRETEESTLLYGLKLESDITWLRRLYFAEDGSRWARYSAERREKNDASFGDAMDKEKMLFIKILDCCEVGIERPDCRHHTRQDNFRACAHQFSKGIDIKVLENELCPTWWTIFLESNPAVEAQFLQQRGFDVMTAYYKNVQENLIIDTIWSKMSMHLSRASAFITFLLQQSMACPQQAEWFDVNEELSEFVFIAEARVDDRYGFLEEENVLWETRNWTLLHKALNTFHESHFSPGATPAPHMHKYDTNVLDVVKVLFANGSDLTIMNPAGETVASLVAEGSNTDRALPKTAAWIRSQPQWQTARTQNSIRA